MMKFYVAGRLALETALRIREEQRETVEAYFPRFFLEEFEKLSEDAAVPSVFLDNLCIEKNTKTSYSRKNYWSDGERFAWRILEGGVFASLWAACEDLEAVRKEAEGGACTGCRVQLFSIPLDQHVLELLELVRENPYEVSSEGCFLVACREEDAEEGFVEIGVVTEDRARILVADGAVRYLTPPARQEKDMENRRLWQSARERNASPDFI